MDPAQLIFQFLDRVRRLRARVQRLHALFLVLTVTLAGALAANGIAYFSEDPRPYLIPFLAAWSIPFLYIFFVAARGVLTRFGRDHAALLVEKQNRDLNNGLINSVQLEPYLKETKSGVSRDFIRELLSRTGRQIEGLQPQSFVPREPLKKSRNVLMGVLTILAVLGLSLPDFWTRGYQNWITPPAEAKVPSTVRLDPGATSPAGPEREYTIESLQLTFNYPAYTRLKPVTLDSKKGKIRVLPGTEVGVRAKANHPLAGGSLVVNSRDNLSMDAVGERTLSGRFIAKEPGYYQFRIKSPSGKKVLLPERYPILLNQDQDPKIIIFLTNPKPVYFTTDKVMFYYEADDDFGLSRVNLVMDVEGRIQRRPIKRFKENEIHAKDGYTWELSTMDFKPGQRVQYYLEVEDNDNVFGPNTGQSEVFTFEVFDEQKKRWDLLALQDELVDKMVDLLAKSLVTHTKQVDNTPEDLQRYKQTLAWNTDRLIEIITLAQTIEAQAKEIGSFPRPYITLMHNIINGLNEVREEHIEAMNAIHDAKVKATPIGYSSPPGGPVTDHLISQLERDILFLVKLSNRERMDQVMDLDKDLANLTETLREEFNKVKNKKAPFRPQQFRKALEQIREIMHRISEQLARQTQGLPDEFLNQGAFENLSVENIDHSLERLKNLIEQGKIDEAMKELEKLADDLRAFSEQLETLDQNQENLVDLEIMKMLDDSLQQLDQMIQDQTGLLDRTTDINKSLRAKQADLFEDKLTRFFENLKKDVNAVQSILEDDEQTLHNHPKMQKLMEWMDRETEIGNEIQELNQEILNNLGKETERRHFGELNTRRQELSDLMDRMQSLKMKMFHGFKNYLPQLTGKYDKLEEFADLMDLYDFNSMFQQTYPDILRWQNHFRTSRDLNPELLEKMNEDLLSIAQLNSEISKKLGTMLRALRRNYQNLLTDRDRENLKNMSKEEFDLSKQAGGLAQLLMQMNQENPMVSPELSNKMNGAKRYMQLSQNRMKQHQVQDSIESENRALKQLNEVKDMLEQLKNSGQGGGSPKSTLRLGLGQSRDPRRGGGSRRMHQEKITLPSEDQYQVPGQFREDILKAMKNQYPQKYERLISEYYKELVK